MIPETYEIVFEKEVSDLSSRAYLLKHKKTKARVFILDNDDNNKVFYIGFRTTPKDSTGVPHIMEHSVLCGSDKYPLKDPFVELAKGSLNTFLNAMTYPDKTVYPVASCNDKDFKNLMSVYMDAVFHPSIYKHPEIMKQEGWSYKIESPDDPIEYNGVVYNEMKGVFSSPSGTMERVIMDSLFPDTTYGVESGGDPDHIPDLTYEAFIDFHKTYYHPSNSFIYLYGDMDFEERLSWLDSEYLSKYDYLEVDSEVGLQKPFEKMNTVIKEYAITDDEDEEDNTYLAYNIVCGDNLDRAKYYAMQMIVYTLVDTQGAPIRKRLLDEGIGVDIDPTYENGICQPYFTIEAKGANEAQAGRFLEIIKEEFKKAADEGLDRTSLKASLNSLKFKYKEADFGGYPKGLIYGLSAFDSWLYDEDAPLAHIEANATFDLLEENIESGYFEDLIKEYLIDNPHSSLVILKPSKGLAAKNAKVLAEKLAAYKASLSEEEIQKLVDDTKALAAFQEEEESEQALETIPLLERSDIERKAPGFSNDERNISGLPVVFHNYNTNGIAYINFYFDANGIKKELLPYLGLLKSVISFVDTENYTYAELNNEINTVMGAFGAGAGVYTNRIYRDKYSLLADVQMRVLYENMESAFVLLDEILFTGNYKSEKRLKEIISELKSDLSESLIGAGHVAASLRAASYNSESSYLKEQINGIEFYKFVEDLEKNFEKEKDKLISALETILEKILVKDGVVISITSDEEGYEKAAGYLAAFANKLKDGKGNLVPVNKRSYDFKGNGLCLEKKNEAFKTSGTVNYISRAGNYAPNGKNYNGAINVFYTIMRYEYMWFNIRMQGGAYGCMCSGSVASDLTFVTYRDPHIKRSNDVFKAIPGYLENFDVTEREMTKFVIGTMSSVDTPLTPAAKGNRDMTAYFSGARYEDIQRAREQIIDCTAQDIRNIAPLIRTVMDQGNIACVGSEGKIEEDKDLFKNVRSLFE